MGSLTREPHRQDTGTDTNIANAIESVQNASAAMGESNESLDMTTLERELVKMAPTIADLFQRITASTQNSLIGHDELSLLKAENERLRKTNRSLIDKLNVFQKQIIQLQLENKKLRESGDGAGHFKMTLKKKSEEMDELRAKIDLQKQQLDEKEQELNLQLQKIQEIETENERQKLQIMNLEMLHEEGVNERKRQKKEIRELREEKELQRTRIEILEDMQKHDEYRLHKLEERLRLLEQWNNSQSTTTTAASNSQPSSHYSSNYYVRDRQSKRRSSRAVSPRNYSSKTTPWMSGVQTNRSHHANVKFQPPPPRGGTGFNNIGFNNIGGGKPTEKGWSF